MAYLIGMIISVLISVLVNALIIYGCITNYLKNLMAENNIYLTVSIGHEPRRGLAHDLAQDFLMRFHSSCWLGLNEVSSKVSAGMGESTSKLSRVVLAGLGPTPHEPLHRAVS